MKDKYSVKIFYCIFPNISLASVYVFSCGDIVSGNLLPDPPTGISGLPVAGMKLTLGTPTPAGTPTRFGDPAKPVVRSLDTLEA